MDVGAGVTVSDGPATDLVLVGGKSKAFECWVMASPRRCRRNQHGMLLWWILKFDRKYVLNVQLSAMSYQL